MVRAQVKELSRILHRLIRSDGVPPSAIAILTSTRRNIPELAPNGRIGAFEITGEHAPDTHRVLAESITRFKGLERDVIVLVKLDPVDYCDTGTLLYVGASRARTHLVVIEAPETLARFGYVESAAEQV